MTLEQDPEAIEEPTNPAEVAGPPSATSRARVIRYGAMGYVGEFSQKPGTVVACGRHVVVQTERGIELGEPLGTPCSDTPCELGVPRGPLAAYVKSSGPEFCQPRAGRILRLATEDDINEHRHLNAHVSEDIGQCAAMIHELRLDMKIITAEHLLGGERIIFYFRSPSRVDFRQLVKELAHRYRTRIEMRQVGARDEARLVADYEVCGRECCCRGFLKKLRPVNMKMAKLQKSTLDPSKVSGRCGRLRCCLRYEHCGYEELVGRLPRVGSRVRTDRGPGTVLDRQILTQLVAVRTDDDHQMTIPLEEILEFNLPPPPPKPPEPPPEPRGGGRDARLPPSRPRPVAEPSPTRTGSPDASAPPAEPTEQTRRSRRRGRGRRGDPPRSTSQADAAPPAPPVRESPPETGGPTRFVVDPGPVSSSGTADAAPPSSGPIAPSTPRDEPPATPPDAERDRADRAGRRRRRGRRRRPRRADGAGGGPTDTRNGGPPAPGSDHAP